MEISFNGLRRNLAWAYNELRHKAEKKLCCPVCERTIDPSLDEEDWFDLHNMIAGALAIYDDSVEGDLDDLSNEITLHGCEDD